MIGCSGKGNDAAGPAPAIEEPKPEPRVVNVGAGETTKRAEDAQDQTVWKIRWKTAKLEYASDLDFGGTMDEVAGTIYMDDQPISDFTAKHGEAFKKSERLVLSDGVKVISRKDGAVLRCDSMEWLPSRKLVAAKGKITIEADGYEAGTFNELWATPDLNAFGTPDMFKDEAQN